MNGVTTARVVGRRRLAPVAVLPQEAFDSGFLSTLVPLAEEAATSTYSKASYYTTLFLYLLSFPGLISLVTRSVKTKVIQRTFVTDGPDAVSPKPLKQVAGEVMAYFTANNYQVADNKGSSVTFKGVVGRSTSQAFFLVFCTFLGMASLALVLSIQFQDLGVNWYYLTLLSPYAGVYYWQRASREDTVTVRIELPDDKAETAEVIVEGGKEELERMAEVLKYNEKGMIRVKGLLENEAST